MNVNVCVCVHVLIQKIESERREVEVTDYLKAT